MHRLPVKGLLAAVAVLALLNTAWANEKVYEQTLPAVVWVVAKDGFGSGAVVNLEKRLVFTNYHVVGANDDVQIVFPVFKEGRCVAERRHYLANLDSLAVAGKVVARDSKRDLALIEAEKLPPGVKALKLAPASAKPGQLVHSIGNPRSSGALWVYCDGRVRQVYENRFSLEGGQVVEARIIETTNPINPGDSGGPLVDDEGNVVGVVSSYRRGAVLFSACIDVTELRGLLDGNNKTQDERVKKLLDQLKLKHTVDAKGTYRLGYRMADDGRQTVYIESKTAQFAGLEIREVWSVAYEADEALPAELANRLLIKNRETKVGAWEVRMLDGKYCAVFCAKVPATFAPDHFRETILAVLRTAYELKKELAAGIE
jgi:hypothetical protein